MTPTKVDELPPLEGPGINALHRRVAALLVVVAAAGYALAFATRSGGGAILVALPCLFLLARVKSARAAFFAAGLCGLAIAVPQLWFFWWIFHGAAVALWAIAALPLALFILLMHQARRRFGPTASMWMMPAVWMGIEFFRSELYYLRFAWILPGQAVAFLPGVRLMGLGVYGLGFVMALGAALLIGDRVGYRVAAAVILAGLAVAIYWPAGGKSANFRSDAARLHVAGIQLEHPSPREAAEALEKLAAAHPEAQLLVLSEYSFNGPVPEVVREVVRKYRRYLVAGGVRREGRHDFSDTAYVVGPDGQDLFRQGKSVPVQFMQDGLPAAQRRVWDSPWGKIGIAICYDIGYARIMDDFVRAGAQGLILPTMDMAYWGQYEREMLHGRLAPVRAAEYGIPVFGVWSSGESQLTDSAGTVIATAGYPGQGEMIAGPFDLAPGHVPVDRWPALLASFFVGGLLIALIGMDFRDRFRRRPARARAKGARR